MRVTPRTTLMNLHPLWLRTSPPHTCAQCLKKLYNHFGEAIAHHIWLSTSDLRILNQPKVPSQQFVHDKN